MNGYDLKVIAPFGASNPYVPPMPGLRGLQSDLRDLQLSLMGFQPSLRSLHLGLKGLRSLQLGLRGFQ